MPQVPDSGQQDVVRISAQGKLRQIGKSRTAALLVDLAASLVAANDLSDFDIEQVRRMQRLARSEHAPFDGFRVRRPQQHFQQSRGINDDHPRSRSARTVRRSDGRRQSGAALQARAQFVDGRLLGHVADFAEQVVGQRSAGQRRSRLEAAVQGVGHIADLDHH